MGRNRNADASYGRVETAALSDSDLEKVAGGQDSGEPATPYKTQDEIVAYENQKAQDEADAAN